MISKSHAKLKKAHYYPYQQTNMILKCMKINILCQKICKNCFVFDTNGQSIYLKHKEKVSNVSVNEQVSFIAMKNTSSVAMVLDPRSEIEDEQGTS